MSHLERENRITYFAHTNTRFPRRVFGIKQRDRRNHMYLIGKTGVGKSTTLKTMIAQDLSAGEGLALLDPHGDLVEEVLSLVPKEREGDLVYLNVPDPGETFCFNPVAGVPAVERALAAAGLVEVFKKLWSEAWGPRLEHLLRNVAFTLLETPGSSLADIPRLFSESDWRKEVVRRISNPAVVSFWRQEFDRYSPGFRSVVIAPLQNKVAAFLSDPILRRILSGQRSSFDLFELMNEGRILLVNLAKGRIGEGPAALLGSLLVSSLGLAGLRRASVPEGERRDFLVYLDEFQTFATLSLATMLAELRKYRISLILANQYFSQLEPEVRDAVLGNAGTLVSFRVGAKDAALLAREFAPEFLAEDLVNLPNYEVYLRLMIDGAVSRAFSGNCLRSFDR